MMKKNSRRKNPKAKIIDGEVSSVEEVNVEAAAEDATEVLNLEAPDDQVDADLDETLESVEETSSDLRDEALEELEDQVDENASELDDEHKLDGEQKEAVEELAVAPKVVKKTSGVTMLGMITSAVLGGGIALGGAGALNQAGMLQHIPFASGLIYGGNNEDAATPAETTNLQGEVDALKASIEKLSTTNIGGGEVVVPEKVLNRISALEISLKSMNANVSKALAGDPGKSAEAIAELTGKVDEVTKSAESAKTGADEALAKVSELSQNVIAGSGGADEATIKAALASETKTLADKITALEADILKLSEATTTTPAVDDTPSEDIISMQSELANLSEQIKSLGEQQEKLDAVEKQTVELGNQITAVNERIETEVLTPMADVQAAAESALTGQQVARSVSARALTSAIEQGGAFSGELSAAEALIGESDLIAKLKPLAASGVKTNSQLSESFEQVLNAISNQQSAPAEDAGILEKFMNNAKSIVKVRPAGPQAGDDAVAIASRVAAGLSNGNLQAAKAELDTLPDSAKQVSADWIKSFNDRLEAQDLVSKLVEMLTTKSEG